MIFFHNALQYAWQICVVLPAKSTSMEDDDGDLIPTTPHYLYFGGKKPDVRRYRMFGCPAVVKVCTRTDIKGQPLDHRNLVQRGIRAVFAGFPINQAGWQFYNPATGKLFTSKDASFDESFSSVATYNDSVHHDSLLV